MRSLCKLFFLFLFCLQLGLGGLEGWGEEVAHLAGGFVQVVAHLGAAETLGNDVEVDATFTNQSTTLLSINWASGDSTYLFSLIM